MSATLTIILEPPPLDEQGNPLLGEDGQPIPPSVQVHHAGFANALDVRFAWLRGGDWLLERDYQAARQYQETQEKIQADMMAKIAEAAAKELPDTIAAEVTQKPLSKNPARKR